MEKIRSGVLAVHTDAGVRYVRPSLRQRLLLLWTFRHFTVLSDQVLKDYERRLVSSLMLRGEPLSGGNGRYVSYCIGTVERLSALPPAKPVERATQRPISKVATQAR